MSNDLFATLKSYLSKVTEGERTPTEVAAALNGWVRDSSEAIKVKIHEEVEASVTRMGFIKREEFDRLSALVEELKAKTITPKETTPKKATPKETTPKKATPKSTTPKKATPKKSASKSAAPVKKAPAKGAKK